MGWQIAEAAHSSNCKSSSRISRLASRLCLKLQLSFKLGLLEGEHCDCKCTFLDVHSIPQKCILKLEECQEGPHRKWAHGSIKTAQHVHHSDILMDFLDILFSLWTFFCEVQNCVSDLQVSCFRVPFCRYPTWIDQKVVVEPRLNLRGSEWPTVESWMSG